jgi:hypothetical protein
MEKEGFGEEFSICSADFFWRNSGGIFGKIIQLGFAELHLFDRSTEL